MNRRAIFSVLLANSVAAPAVAMVERAVAQFEAEGLDALTASGDAQYPSRLDRGL